MSDNVHIFGEHKKRIVLSKKDEIGNHIARFMRQLTQQYDEKLVLNCLIDLVSGMISVYSNNPHQDLLAAAHRIVGTNWQKHKKLHFAAMNGISPEEALREEAVSPESGKPIGP